jgi:hypothetical protein
MKRILVVIGALALAGLAYDQWVLPGKVEASMNIVLPHEPYVVSDEARQLHDSLFVVDLHSDSLLWKRDLTKESGIGHVDVPQPPRLFDRGLRVIGLTHFFDNELGGSLHGTSGEGLSELGRAVVRRANELNVIIDIAHASPAMVEDVLALSTSVTGMRTSATRARME